eukprot:3791824-Alexandrium_andersonii.AAC.1
MRWGCEIRVGKGPLGGVARYIGSTWVGVVVSAGVLASLRELAIASLSALTPTHASTRVRVNPRATALECPASRGGVGQSCFGVLRATLGRGRQAVAGRRSRAHSVDAGLFGGLQGYGAA